MGTRVPNVSWIILDGYRSFRYMVVSLQVDSLHHEVVSLHLRSRFATHRKSSTHTLETQHKHSFKKESRFQTIFYCLGRAFGLSLGRPPATRLACQNTAIPLDAPEFSTVSINYLTKSRFATPRKSLMPQKPNINKVSVKEAEGSDYISLL